MRLTLYKHKLCQFVQGFEFAHFYIFYAIRIILDYFLKRSLYPFVVVHQFIFLYNFLLFLYFFLSFFYITMEDTMWFYIKHVHSGKVISVSNEQDQQKSQVIVTEAKYTDSELWCWNDQRLQNKRTKLVLDIRNGNHSYNFQGIP